VRAKCCFEGRAIGGAPSVAVGGGRSAGSNCARALGAGSWRWRASCVGLLGAVACFVALAGAPAALALPAPRLYWANVGTNTIGEANLDGTGVNQSFLTGASGGVAVDASHVYWNNGGGTTIAVANLDGTGVNQSLITGIRLGLGVAVDGSHIYWADLATNTIGRANLDGTDVNQSFITGASLPEGVVVDASHIYWTNRFSGTIGVANLSGTGVNQSFITGATGLFGLADDGSRIYWTNASAGTIGEANLDGAFATQSLVTGTVAAQGIAVTMSVPFAQVAPAAPPAFPATPQGTLSAPQKLTITNTGQQSLSITGLSFTGASAGDFIISADGCLGPLAPGDACQLGVSFAPQGVGSRAATLQIASTDSAHSPLEVPLSGIADPSATGAPGPQGPQGPQGAPGTRGPAGTIICRDNGVARVLCALEFAPGSYTVSSADATAKFTVTRGRHIVAHGTFKIRNGHLSTKRIPRLQRGRYTLTITVARGHHTKSLLRTQITLP
jgi:virginiamycin B lyase